MGRGMLCNGTWGGDLPPFTTVSPYTPFSHQRERLGVAEKVGCTVQRTPPPTEMGSDALPAAPCVMGRGGAIQQ